MIRLFPVPIFLFVYQTHLVDDVLIFTFPSLILAAPNPTNPLAVSELRRQRDLFEQKKKQKFVEKQRRKRRTREDQSDGGTYSIKSDDIDEGVGVSMISGDVTTAATWGGSTEQSSTEEDSAVGEEEFQELDGQEVTLHNYQ